MKFKVPTNISLETELFRGFNKKATIITSIIFLISVLISVIIYSIIGEKSMLVCVFLVVFSVSASITALTKYESNMSVVDYLHHMIKFIKSQKKFTYESEASRYANNENSK